MEYTEEVKTESDSVIKRIVYEISDHTTLSEIRGTALKLAIQDRQSVLKEVEQAFKTTGVFHSQYWLNRIQSLTQQIEYFKSKL